MKLWIQRFGFGNDTTAGRLFDATEQPPKFLCWTLEDEKRLVKVPGQTCIPTGVYKVVPRTVGRMHDQYKQKFGDRHRGMLWIAEPEPEGFTFTYIHIGNYAYEGDDAPAGMTKDDTLGCPLVGDKLIMTDHAEFELRASTPAYEALNARVTAAWERKEEVFITVSDK